MVRATLDEAAVQWRRTVDTEVLGRYDLVDEEKYTGRVTAPATRQQQLLVRRGPGLAAGDEAAIWNMLAQRIGALCSVLARTPTARGPEVICNTRRKFYSLRWHIPPAMWRWWKSRRKSLSRWTDARLQVVQQICTQKAGLTERAASRARAAGLEGLGFDDSDGWCAVGASLDQAAPWAAASVDANVAEE